MGRYPWRVKPPKGRDTLDWYCSLGITYNDGFQSTSGRSFRIRASPSSSSSSSSTTSTTTSTMATTMSTATSTTAQPTSGESSGSNKSNNLGAGAIAGVVVGGIAGIGVFATLIGLVVYYRRKALREKKLDSTMTTTTPDEPGAAAAVTADTKGNPNVDTQYLKPELDAVYAQYMKPELEANGGTERVYYELDGAHLILEVEGPVHLPELDSNARSDPSGNNRPGGLR